MVVSCAMANNQCYNCFQACKPLYCRGCYKVFYCSQSCQKAHWKAGHKHTCTRKISSNDKEKIKPDDEKAYKALLEMKSNIDKLSLNELHENFYKLQENIKILQEEQVINRGITANSEKKDVEIGKSSIVRKSQGIEKQQKENIKEHSTTKEVTRKSKLLKLRKEASSWSYTIELLNNISCYRITLLRPYNAMFCNQYTHDNINYTIQNNTCANNAICNIQVFTRDEEILFHEILPGEIMPSSSKLSIEPDCIVLRLQYATNSVDEDDYITKEFPGFTLSNVNNIHCRSCNARLTSKNIHKVLQIPKHDWSEVYDYITCYQSNDDTMSSELINFQNQYLFHKEGVVWDSTQYLIYHMNDILLDSVDLDDSKVACSTCHYDLGFYVSDGDKTTLSLYKHCLTNTTESHGLATDIFSNHTFATFMANKMVQYADSQSIFSFIVEKNNGQNKTNTHMLLHLLSWDTTFAIKAQDQEDILFRKYVKVAFKVRFNRRSSRYIPNIDVMSNNQNACCPPITLEQKQHVMQCNTNKEWEELLHVLQNNMHHFPKSIMKATLSVIPKFNEKLGRNVRMEPHNSSSGISIIPLL